LGEKDLIPDPCIGGEEVSNLSRLEKRTLVDARVDHFNELTFHRYLKIFASELNAFFSTHSVLQLLRPSTETVLLIPSLVFFKKIMLTFSDQKNFARVLVILGRIVLASKYIIFQQFKLLRKVVRKASRWSVATPTLRVKVVLFSKSEL